MRSHFLTFTIFCIISTLLSCTSDETNPTVDFPIQPSLPQPQEERSFGINISEGELGFENAFQMVNEIGINVVELNIPWSHIEPEIGKYQDPSDILAATYFYGEKNVKVSFSIAVINTVKWEVPAGISNIPANDPEFIQAFTNMMDWFMTQIPGNLEIAGISIGNEIDLVLEGEQEWNEYISFFDAATDHMHSNYPEITIGVKNTVMHGFMGNDRTFVERINQNSDVIMLNYYPHDENSKVLPPNQIITDFDLITSTFSNKKIWINEVGYQSGSTYNQSSEEKQAEFFHHMFTAWDQHNDQIELMIVNWLHDQPTSTIEEWKLYYGDSPGLVEFLSTLGLRNYNNTDKKAWIQVKEELKTRNWSN